MTRRHQQRLTALVGGQLAANWRPAYDATPRHLFAPDRAGFIADGGRPEIVDRADDPDGWMAAVYSERVILTQADDAGRVTSSCSLPSLVFRMLTYLDARPGMRVLEIGTGTGWNAAMLAHRLGAHQVYTIEVDPEVIISAQANLAKLDRQPPHVILGDGERGWSSGAPYDRVIATCAVNRVPPAWIAQTRPGGVVLSPWGTPLHNGALARLTVAGPGTASGRFIEPCAFMWLRAQQFHTPDEPDDFIDRAERSTATGDLDEMVDDPAMFTAGLLVPDCKMSYDHHDDGTVATMWLLARGSWASLTPATGELRQLGQRHLWDEFTSAYRWWITRDRPSCDRYGLSVLGEQHIVWLDKPTNTVTRW